MSRQFRLLAVIVMAALLCLCARPAPESVNQCSVSVSSVTILKCENRPNSWCMHIVINASNSMLKYEGVKIKGNSINVYFESHSLNGSGETKKVYTKHIDLGNLKGEYRIKIFVNGVAKKSFIVYLS